MKRGLLMRCETCQGDGLVSGNWTGEQRNNSYRPCPNCNGTGLQHCCEGVCAQPEEEDGSREVDPVSPISAVTQEPR